MIPILRKIKIHQQYEIGRENYLFYVVMPTDVRYQEKKNLFRNINSKLIIFLSRHMCNKYYSPTI